MKQNLTKIPENIKAMKELLHWYETGENEPGRCPLCTANDQGHPTAKCETCPWVTVGGATSNRTCNPCANAINKVSAKRETRPADFLAVRIPQLKEWIEAYEEAQPETVELTKEELVGKEVFLADCNTRSQVYSKTIERIKLYTFSHGDSTLFAVTGYCDSFSLRDSNIIPNKYNHAAFLTREDAENHLKGITRNRVVLKQDPKPTIETLTARVEELEREVRELKGA